MSATGVACLVNCPGGIEYPRNPSKGTLHDVQKVQLITICTTPSSVGSFDYIGFWARTTETWLRCFLILERGIPSQCRQLVSIGTMWCQKGVAARIVKNESDYLPAVNGNQPSLLLQVASGFIDGAETVFGHGPHDPTHGRVVQRSQVLPPKGGIDLVILPRRKTIGVVDFPLKNGDIERRSYISSRELSADDFAPAVWSYWGIGSRLHRILEVGFGEDDGTTHLHNAPKSFSSPKKVVLNVFSSTRVKPLSTGIRNDRVPRGAMRSG